MEELVLSGKDRLFDKVRKRHEGEEFVDDDALFNRISEDYDDLDSQLGQYQKDSDVLAEMFESDPRSVEFLKAWKDGADPVVVMWERYGADILEDPNKKEALAEANKKYLDRLAQEKKLEEEYTKNLDSSLDVMDAYQAKNSLSDEDIDEAISFLIKLGHDCNLGKITEEGLDMAMKAIRHDVDVAEAEHEGVVRGRNEKITNEVKRRAGDGTPRLDGKSHQAQPRRQRLAMFELADEAM
jgi:hypothetical protein